MDFNVQFEGAKNISVEFNEPNSFGTDLGLGSVIAVGSNDHAKLKNRDAEDQHPIKAITKLQEALDATPNEALSNQDIEEILNLFI